MGRPAAILLCVLFLLAGTGTAGAGAWLEQVGGGFLSASLRARPSGQELGAYAAYGLTPRLSFGIDINQSRDEGRDSAHALAFVRLPLRQRDQGWQLAVEVAAGQARSGADWTGMQRLTLSAGRGLDWRGQDWRGPDWQAGTGWVALDLAREWRGSSRAWKLDTTLGVNRAHGPAPMLQAELYLPEESEMIWKLLPALRWSLSSRRELVTGVEWRSSGSARLGLKVELWHRF